MNDMSLHLFGMEAIHFLKLVHQGKYFKIISTLTSCSSTTELRIFMQKNYLKLLHTCYLLRAVAVIKTIKTWFLHSRDHRLGLEVMVW